MTVTTFLRSVLAATVLAAVTGCGASSVPDGAGATATAGSGVAAPSRSTNVQPVSAVMPDVTGGNAGRAYEQMRSEIDMVFKDASGRGRPVDDPAGWKICGSRPGPYQQITDYPVVFEVVKVSESCEDVTPKR
ncbi:MULTISPECIES: hypothetical protein [unclassified Streptomyces]|uniref:hypothetical protein n=1 Tax=unclassified Streptomyces TaxID=2593676 RepID=UPI0011CEBC62|nr:MULTISPECIES: hypothetical protein [unclassified Streptomyces]TXS62152.1 hypothetical protein EAO69_37380 [Streptomyces sp. me109]